MERYGRGRGGGGAQDGVYAHDGGRHERPPISFIRLAEHGGACFPEFNVHVGEDFLSENVRAVSLGVRHTYMNSLWFVAWPSKATTPQTWPRGTETLVL